MIFKNNGTHDSKMDSREKMKNYYTENILEAPLDETVCWCSSVSIRSVLDAIGNGAQNMDDIRRMTGACTQGRCKELSPRGRCCSKEIKLLLEAETKPQGE
jgi:NAD(P)H-nitrite reductase large subunit